MDIVRVRGVTLPKGSTMLEAIRAMDAVRCGIALVVDELGRLVGVVTDGDARRAILNGVDLTTHVDGIMSREPVVLPDGVSRQEAVSLLRSERCRRFKSVLIPSLDKAGRPVNILHSSEILSSCSPDQQLLPEAERPIHALLIGGAGYIGSMLSRVLLADGYQVTILDRFLYGNESIEGVQGHPLLEVVHGDTRHIEDVVSAVRKVQAVVHLAELVGDPLCARDGQATLEINYLATAAITRACAHLQVNRFIYLSSCSVYGASAHPDKVLDEGSALAPLSLYARMKVNSESVIKGMHAGNFSPCVFRLGTVFGLSFRPRFDLVVNTLTAKAVCEHGIDIHGGDQWRPHVHVKDVAQAVQLALKAPIESVRGQVFNIVGVNHKIGEVGEMVKTLIPGTTMNRVGDALDRRDYRVSADKARQVLGFRPGFSVPDGIQELSDALRSGTIRSYKDRNYYNIHAFGEDRLHA